MDLQFDIPWRTDAQQLIENSIQRHHGTCIACPDPLLPYGAQGLIADHENWLLPASSRLKNNGRKERDNDNSKASIN